MDNLTERSRLRRIERLEESLNAVLYEVRICGMALDEATREKIRGDAQEYRRLTGKYFVYRGNNDRNNTH